MWMAIVVVPLSIAIVVAVVVAVGAMSRVKVGLSLISAILWEMPITPAFVTRDVREALMSMVTKFLALRALNVTFVKSGA